MKTLKDVYIKVTEKNYIDLLNITNRSLIINYYLHFLSDDVSLGWIIEEPAKDKQKVSLSQLKRLIETIPTREEITRLKRQISAYKTNYDKVVKHSLSKEGVIEDLQKNNSELIQKLINANRDLKNKYSEIQKLKDDLKKVRGERDSLDASYKTLNDMFDYEVKENERVAKLYNDSLKETEMWRLDYVSLYEEYRRLKNKKWYQIW